MMMTMAVCNMHSSFFVSSPCFTRIVSVSHRKKFKVWVFFVVKAIFRFRFLVSES